MSELAQSSSALLFLPAEKRCQLLGYKRNRKMTTLKLMRERERGFGFGKSSEFDVVIDRFLDGCMLLDTAAGLNYMLETASEDLGSAKDCLDGLGRAARGCPQASLMLTGPKAERICAYREITD